MATVIVLQSLSLLYVQSEFNMNRAYIAKVLCINRDQPQMQCEGKCFLKKELNRKAAQESSNQKDLPTHSGVTLFIDQQLKQPIYPAAQEVLKQDLQNYSSSGYLITSEHPPTV